MTLMEPLWYNYNEPDSDPAPAPEDAPRADYSIGPAWFQRISRSRLCTSTNPLAMLITLPVTIVDYLIMDDKYGVPTGSKNPTLNRP